MSAWETACLLFFGILIGIFIDDCSMRNMIRKELVEKNVAHYEADAKTGKTVFISPYKFSGGVVK